MADFLQMASLLREQMQATLSRSDVLRVLIWPIGMLLIALVGTIASGAPTWLIGGMGVFCALLLTLYIAAFIFLLVYDRDALRSENYSLQRFAIERGLFGTSTTGLIRPNGDQGPVIPADEVVKLEPPAEDTHG